MNISKVGIYTYIYYNYVAPRANILAWYRNQ